MTITPISSVSSSDHLKYGGDTTNPEGLSGDLAKKVQKQYNTPISGLKLATKTNQSRAMPANVLGMTADKCINSGNLFTPQNWHETWFMDKFSFIVTCLNQQH